MSRLPIGLLFTLVGLVGCDTAADLDAQHPEALPTPVAGQLPLPQTMTAFGSAGVNQYVAGKWIDLSVLGAAPGATVGIAVSNGASGPGDCPAWLGDCLDITPGTSGYRFAVLGTADSSGDLYFHANLPRSFAAGSYVFQALSPDPVTGVFTASTVFQKDVLAFSADCPNGDDANEPDDRPAFATPVSIGTSATGSIVCTEDDIDWYAIDLTAGQTLNVDIFFSNAEGDVDLYVMDAPYANNSDILNQNYEARSWTTSDDETITYVAPADGTYYIAVRLYRDAGALPGNTYDIDVF
ncbi:MAG: PPC domain-containing protein [Alphaproteobacteria bacterium]|nr:PPC domain-containing protein [Alphaproteobacteria bacterium]